MTVATKGIESLYDWRHALGGTNKEYTPIAQADVHLLRSRLDLSTVRVCDVGCGEGVHLRILVEAGAHFPIGIDLSGRALEKFLESNSADKVVLVRGDFTSWGMRQEFDAVICSLPPLAPEGPMNLLGLTSALHRLLKHKGMLLLKLFTLERVPSIVGNYAVRYDGATTTCYSDVRYEDHRNCMVIEQYTNDETIGKRIEVLALPSHDDVRLALETAGFQLDAPIGHTTASLPGTEVFLARA